MDKFSVISSKSGKTLYLQMAGRLSEEADLKNIDVSSAEVIRIDLANLANLSSLGVRSWMQWVNGIDRGKNITLENCPKVFVNMVNLVHNMVPAHLHIKSIGIPYFCTKCGNSFCENMELTENLPQSLSESKPCANCGADAELDTLPEKYFRFLEERD